mgnify:FL=1
MCGHGALIPTGYMPAGAQEKSFGAAMRATGIVGAFLEGSPHCGGKALFATVGAVFQWKRLRVFPYAAVYLIKANPEQFIVLCAFTDHCYHFLHAVTTPVP